MANTLLSRPLQEVAQEITVAIRNRVTDSRRSVLVANGIVRIQFVSDLEFATEIFNEAYGDLYLMNDDESLALSKVSPSEYLTHVKREFGKAYGFGHSDIQKLTGNQMNLDADFIKSKSYEEAKSYLIDLNRAYSAQSATNQIMRYAYGVLTGTVTNTRSAGGTEDLTFAVTDGLSVGTTWATNTTDIISDMVAVENALTALPEPQTITNGHTIMGLPVLQAIRKNNSVKALFNNTANLTAIPAGAQFDSTLGEYFGNMVLTQETYKNEAKQSVKLFDDNYIIVTPETQIEPIVTILVAPTQLDPSYVNTQDGTGFSIREYDGLVDQSKSVLTAGKYEVGIRGRIAAFVRNPSRIYKKKVLNV